MIFSRAGEPANFFAAPAPDFFFKRLRLLIFSQAAPAPDFYPGGSGSKESKTTGSGSPALIFSFYIGID